VSRGLHGLARRWWSGDLGAGGSILDVALAPAEAVYRFGVGARDRAYRRGLLEVVQVSVPVISIGNVAVGGTGKTPFAHWIAVAIRDRGMRPAVLHGGYADDEPELHRRWSPDIPVIAERDRVAGADRAIAAGANALVLDDGFQHRRLHRDLDIVLVAAERWDDPPRLLPRGPWREPRAALRRADLVVVTRKTADAATAERVAAAIAAMRRRLRVATAHIRPAGWQYTAGSPAAGATALGAPQGAALLVSGLAEPALSSAIVLLAGAGIGDMLTYPDHHVYTRADAAAIREAAAGRPIVTTEKDWTKLGGLLAGTPVWLLTQEVVVEHGADGLHALLDEVLA
jgi:tetraacyldisaccharide 4'-kinase